MEQTIKDKLRQNTYYIVIGIVSLFSLVFLPMLGSTIAVGFVYPATLAGQIVFWVTKIIMAGLNVLIFHSFNLQGKVNIQDNEKYKKANEILGRIKIKEYKPRSPQAFNLKVYGVKAVTVFLTTGLSTFALTQAILTFDYVTLLTYLFVVVMGIVFGILQMKKTELYFSSEYYDYAVLQELQIKEDKECQSLSMEKNVLACQTVSETTKKE